MRVELNKREKCCCSTGHLADRMRFVCKRKGEFNSYYKSHCAWLS